MAIFRRDVHIAFAAKQRQADIAGNSIAFAILGLAFPISNRLEIAAVIGVLHGLAI